MEFDFESSKKGASSDKGASNIETFSVSDLSAAIKRTVEGRFSHVKLRGEISGFRGPHSSGHAYFSIKDEKARIEAVIWRGVFSKLPFKPEEGLEVIVTGKISTFGGKSSYQIIIDSLEPAGEGALMALLKERRKQLEKEGLFDKERKKPLPFLPATIGIITSPTGAVIRDMMHGFRERFPVHVLIWPVRVQGETSAREVARAIDGFNKFEKGGKIPRPDVLIVARGGGSLEDLWGFNEEVCVRAASESEIPIISAIGHETDWSLMDLVADDRSPTPTKAAERAVPKYTDLVQKLADLKLRTLSATSRRVQMQRTHLSGLTRGLPKAVDLFAPPRKMLDSLTMRSGAALLQCASNYRRQFAQKTGRFHPQLLTNRLHREKMGLTQVGANLHKSLLPLISRKRQWLAQEAKLLNSLSYRNVLDRGFALVRSDQGTPVRFVKDMPLGKTYDVELSDGIVQVEPRAGAKKTGTKEKKTIKKETRRKPKQTKKGDDDAQGSLL